MDLSFLTNAWLRLRWQGEQLGTPGKIGLGLIIFSAVFFIAAVLPKREESRALMVKIEAMQAQTQIKAERAQPSKAATRKVMHGNQGLQVFYEFFSKH